MFFSSNKSKSLYLKLGFSFFILIFITTILQTSYTYFSTKKELYSEIENNINVSLKQLENSVITFVESYQVNNYNRIIKNEMAHQNLLAIILEDYVTGKIIGEDKYISGFFRNNEFEVIEYNIKNIEHKHQMNTSIFSKELELKNSQNETIAILKIYGTDYYINKKLFTIIKESLLNTLVMYSLIFLLIYFLIKKELINPIKNITTSLIFTQDSSIIAMEINQNSSIEFSTLTNSINKLISDIKKAHKDLEDSKFRWEFAVDGSGYGLWDWNTQTNEVFFSKRWKEMLGFKDEEIKGSLEEWKKKVHPDDLEQVFKDITDYLNGVKNFYRNEHRVKCKNGKYIWILDRGMIVERDLEGQPIRIIGTHEDISKQIVLEKEIQEEKERYKNLTNYSSDAIFIVNIEDGKLVEFSKRAKDLLGYDDNEMKNLSIFDWETNINSMEEYKKIISHINQTPIYFERVHKRKDGSQYHAGITSVKIILGGKEYFYASIRDISNEVNLKNNLKDRDELLQNFSNQVPGVLYTYQYFPDGRSCFPFASDHISEIYEVTPSSVLNDGQKVLDRIYEKDFDFVADSIVESYNTLKVWKCTYRVNLPKKGLRWLYGEAQPVKQDDDSVIWFGYIKDITEQKEIEAKNNDTTLKLELATSASKQGIWRLNFATNNLELDDNMYKIYGITPQKDINNYELFRNRILKEDLPIVE